MAIGINGSAIANNEVSYSRPVPRELPTIFRAHQCSR
jgi:hypothetical protein